MISLKAMWKGEFYGTLSKLPGISDTGLCQITYVGPQSCYNLSRDNCIWDQAAFLPVPHPRAEIPAGYDAFHILGA